MTARTTCNAWRYKPPRWRMRDRVLVGALASLAVLAIAHAHDRALDHKDDRICWSESPAVAVCGTPDEVPENVITFGPENVTRSR